MTIKSKTDLTTEFTTNLADNTTGDISPSDVRTAFTDLMDSTLGVYGGLYTADGVTAQSLDTTPALFTGWAGEVAGLGVTPSAASNSITVGTAGVYLVCAQMSGEGAAGQEFQFHIRLDGAEVTGAGARLKQTNAGDKYSLSIFSPVACTASQVLTIYGESDAGGGANYTLADGQFFARRIV
jgi:hypothetical protein